jgi:hypothetical protein
MLSQAEIERWSRQIVLPEVGARGQERLCAARVAVWGTGAAAAVAADLLARAGVTVTREPAAVVLDLEEESAPAPDAPIVVRGRLRGARLVVATLVGRPCGICSAGADLPLPEGRPGLAALGPAAARVLGALAATEALGGLLFAPRTGRLQTVDLEAGRFAAAALPRTAGCSRCRELA